MNTIILTNAQVITPEESFTGSLSIEDGIISGVYKGKVYREGIDLQGQWLTPGCIDIHTDYLEKELHPRSSASFPLSFALHFLDARAASCGITTVFSAISFSEDRNKLRSLDHAIGLAREIDAARRGLLVKHFLHARIDPNTDAILAALPELSSLESLALVVFNENIPGQRQFTMEQSIAMRMKEQGFSREEAVERLLRQIEETRNINHRQAITDAFRGRFVIGSHDDTTEAHILEAAAAGAVLAEMPTTLSAARKAREQGMWICMGAPNYYRGGSHCGNLSCADALAEGLVDILCSDYHFPTMLGSVVRMIGEGIAPWQAMNLVSLNPARLLGTDDTTGSIAVGKQADLICWNAAGGYAAVKGVWVGGISKLSANYNQPVLTLAG
jgi:alpha-D-ribose 1-methylphosphonate 5-triphosphate diphosphatase